MSVCPTKPGGCKCRPMPCGTTGRSGSSQLHTGTQVTRCLWRETCSWSVSQVLPL